MGLIQDHVWEHLPACHAARLHSASHGCAATTRMESKQAEARPLRKSLSPLSHSQTIKIKLKNAKINAKKARREQESQLKRDCREVPGMDEESRPGPELLGAETALDGAVPGHRRGSLLCPGCSGRTNPINCKAVGRPSLPAPLHPTLP